MPETTRELKPSERLGNNLHGCIYVVSWVCLFTIVLSIMIFIIRSLVNA